MQIRITVFALAIAATGPLFASDIFKWTDEDGDVHYSDRPTELAGVERVAIRSQPTDRARIQADVQAHTDEQNRRAEEEANAPQGPTQEERDAQARWREGECNKYTERQSRFTENRRIYYLDDDGERVYYDEEGLRTVRARVDELVEKYCN